MFVAKIKNSAKNPLIRTLAIFLALLCSVTAGLALWYWHYCQSPAQLTAETTVFIPRGVGVRQIGTLLAAQGVLRNDIRYLTYLRLSGLGEKLKAGEYAFAPGITPPQVLGKIARGEVVRHPVTIAEGLRLTQIAAIFAQDGWVDPARFLALAQDTAFIRSLGLNVEEGMEINSLEGYLFPDTYLMVRDEAPASAVPTVPTEPTGKPQELQKSQGTREEKLIRHMVQRFEDVWASLPKTGQAGLSRHQVLTLASVVEKETGQAQERPLIARVFLNRLELGMRLQSDPTVIYGLGDAFSGNLRRKDLRTPSAHNTYVIPGLPPGPICSPGRAALAAVLAPAQSNALYFVSRNDGSHVFSTTLAEHNRAVNTYQRQGRKDQTTNTPALQTNPAAEQHKPLPHPRNQDNTAN